MIRKGEGVHDLWDFINAAIAADNPSHVTALLADSHHELEHSDITGVEGDAAHEAYRKGLINDDSINRAYWEGPTNPRYMEAFRKLVLAGAPLINSLVDRQNLINQGRGIHPMNRPFEVGPTGGYKVNAQWGHKPHALSVSDAKRASGGQYINPWDPQTRTLITNIKSKKNLQGEGWLRPYAEALEERRSSSGVQGRKRTSETIHPGLVHRNAIRIPDGNALVELWNVAKTAAAQASSSGQDPVQAAHAALLENKTFRKVTGGIHHQPYAPGKYSEQAMAQTLTEQGIPDEQQIDQMGDPTPSAALHDALVQGGDMSHFIHPELVEQGWYQKLHGPAAGGLRGYYKGGGGRASGVKALGEMHGMSEEEANAIYDAAANKTIHGRTYSDRWHNALAQHEMRDGVKPTWVKDGMQLPGAAQPLTNQTKAPPPDQAQQQQPVVQGEGMNQEQGGMQMVHPDTASIPPSMGEAPPPNMGAAATVPPPLQTNVAAPPNAINTGSALDGRPPAPTRRGFMDSLGEAMGRLYGRTFPGGLFGKSESEKEQIEHYLEQVQIDIAKAELLLQNNAQMNPESPIDISLVAGRLNKSSSDITAIINSRGDWRNIAKSFNVPHEVVQEVKVIFHE